jgi:alkanesulfonate monooxygenase SsuD/methylene tetrahydromethanopterin reductase-like flavin-dependent oxidoreductase (luciferase family)
MNFGMLLLFAHAGKSISEAELFKSEVDVGVFAEECGLDSVWAPEHHFDAPYCMSPDNIDVLNQIAARTSKIKLGTGAIILPWHDSPLRLVERLSMLDVMSGGRVLLGLGRGLARIEYETFGVEMEDSRGRFDEAAQIVMNGLRDGVVEEFNGKYHQQPRATIHPKSEHGGWDERLHTIAMSPPSIQHAADFGGALMCFNYQYPIEQQAEVFNDWRERYKAAHGVDAPPPVLLDFFYCHEDPDHVEAHMKKYLGAFYNAMVDHYEFDGKHFGKTHGYESYQDGSDMLREVGREAAFQGFYDLQLKGTPDQVIETINKRRELIGDYQQMFLCSYGGQDFADVKASLKLMGDKVIPAINGTPAPTPVAAD